MPLQRARAGHVRVDCLDCLDCVAHGKGGGRSEGVRMLRCASTLVVRVYLPERGGRNLAGAGNSNRKRRNHLKKILKQRHKAEGG